MVCQWVPIRRSVYPGALTMIVLTSFFASHFLRYCTIPPRCSTFPFIPQIFKKLADCGVHAAPSPFGGSMVEIAA